MTWSARSSACVSHLETTVKLILQWHYSPDKISQIFCLVSPLCWRLCGLKETLFHVWWACPIIKPFWLKLFQFQGDVTQLRIQPNPALALFNMDMNTCPKESRALTSHLFIAARGLLHSGKIQRPLHFSRTCCC